MECRWLGGFEPHGRGALSAPAALHWSKDCRVGLDECRLLCRRQLDHSQVLTRVGDCREDLSTHPEIRMAHVSAFGCFGKTQSNVPEIFSGQSVSPFLARC